MENRERIKMAAWSTLHLVFLKLWDDKFFAILKDIVTKNGRSWADVDIRRLNGKIHYTACAPTAEKEYFDFNETWHLGACLGLYE